MPAAFIIDAIRTPMARGKPGGALSGTHPVELLAAILRTLVNRSSVDPSEVDDILVGCVSQVGEQSNNVGRMALLAAGFPEHVPASTIERKCGSSQQAIHFAAQGIMAGAYDVVIAAGVESMSRIPMGSARFGMDVFGPTINRRYAPGLVSQGVAAELVAQRWNITRADMDAYAARSHALAEETRATGGFDREIVPVCFDGVTIDRDETIRPGTTAEALSGLKPAFATAEHAARFPDLDWGVTPGNASQLTDGAAAVLLMSEQAATRYGLTPRARFVGMNAIGDDPLLMLTAPIPATRRILEKTGMRLQDIDHFEVNEAFASVPLAWQKELHADPARLNPRGGAIALGHPLGASGARLLATMLGGLEQTGSRYGLQTMCEAGGMANATVIERI
jgi:acetyl-CoA acetyltransferase family protein